MRRLAAFLVVLACAAAARAGWWDDACAAKTATLADVRRDPGLWRDLVVSLDVRLVGVVEPGDAEGTRFTARDWRALAVFPADAAPEAAAGRKPFASIFVRRGSEAERRVEKATPGARVALRVVVRESVRGEPWMEALEATADDDPPTPEETDVVARADDFVARANPAAAEALYRGLVAKRAFPAAVRADLWRKIGAACWTLRRVKDAADAYAAAVAADPTNAGASRGLETARAALWDAPLELAPKPTVVAQAAIADVPAPARRLLPPIAADAAPSPSPPPPSPLAAPRPAEAGAFDPVPAPGSNPTPSRTAAAPSAVEEPPPPAPPKPRLAGPK